MGFKKWKVDTTCGQKMVGTARLVLGR